MRLLSFALPLCIALLHSYTSAARYANRAKKPCSRHRLKDTSFNNRASAHGRNAGHIGAIACPKKMPAKAKDRHVSRKHHHRTSSTSTSKSCSVPQIIGAVQTVSVPPSAPSEAVQVPRNFIGFGFETAFLNNYCVGEFSENVVNSVAKRLGEPLIIRVGGTSGDRFAYDPGQPDIVVCTGGDCPIGSSASYTFGPSYFDGFKCFPDQHWTFQAGLGSGVDYTTSLDYVTLAYAAAGADRVDAIAIGNEPGVNSPDFNLQSYMNSAAELEEMIVEALNLSTGPVFELFDLASGEASGDFSVSEMLTDSVDSLQRTKYVAQHYYQAPNNLPAYGVAELQSLLMNHSAITSKFQQGYIQTLQSVQVSQPNVSYIISESGSSLIGPPLEFQDAFGAALWWVDYNFYAMSIGVKRIDASARPAAPHSFWVPDASANAPGPEQNVGPQVRAPYYAIPMLADFIGTSSGSVVELLGEDTSTAYAIYDQLTGKLSRVALVNLNYWSADSGLDRGATTFEVHFDVGAKWLIVKHLHADAGAHAQGYDVQGQDGMITWAGETWSYVLDRGSGSTANDTLIGDIVTLCNGLAVITVPDSEAVVVYMS